MTYRRAFLATFLVGLLFLISMLHATGGRPSLPLDDSFIYFQYASRAAEGHPLSYQAGEARTTGSTSLPWMALLSVGSLLGFGGKSIVFFAFALGGLTLALALKVAADAQDALAPRKPGSERPGELPIFGLPLAAALVLLAGPFQWGVWSGMEIPLVALALLLAFREFVRGGARPTGPAAAATFLVGAVRPEGALLAGIVAVAWIWNAAREKNRDGLPWVLLVLASVFFQPAVYALATGDPRSTGYVAKSLLAAPHAELLDVLRVAILRAASLGRGLFSGFGPVVDGQGLYAYDSETIALWTVPGAGLLFLVGVLPAVARELGERRAGPGLLTLGWIAAILLATSLVEEPDAHFSRYQMPILPLFLVWVAIGTGRLARILRDVKAGFARITVGLRAWLALGGVVSVLFFAGAYGDNCRDIDGMQIRVGESLAEALGPDDVVAINDAGAIAYFSGRRTLDLIGLTTPGFAGLWGQGTGVLWEKLEALPAARRPGWFCIFPNWFDFEAAAFLNRQGSVRLLSPSVVDAEKVLYRADWSAAGSGDLPAATSVAGFANPDLVDRLDVADVDSESAHSFAWTNGEGGGDAGSFVRRAPVDSDPNPITDGGRSFLDTVSFEVARAPLRPATLLVRSVSGVTQVVDITIDGRPSDRVEIRAPGAGRFHEQAIATLERGTEPARVTLRVVGEFAPPLILAHVFVVAGETP
ncbi:MAG: hypothetical protein R3B81_17315 [bacterium]